jgi:hypothetical protein
VIQRTLTRTSRLLLVLAAAIFACLGAMAAASSVYAAPHHPTGEYAPFADCPLSNQAAEACIVARSESGKFVIGNEAVPLMKTVTLQGGLHNIGSEHEEFIGAEDGNTLTNVPLKVPGGLLALVKCNEITNIVERVACELTFDAGVTGVNATTQLSAPASSVKLSFNLLSGEGIALSLPIEVHLENPFLGSSCYVGSNAHPIVVEFTTGTTSPSPPNVPITGKPGEPSFNESGTILRIEDNELVNNSFAAPTAEGCGGLFAFLIDPIIDSRLGLPSAGGHNTAILAGTQEIANAAAVKASE